MFVWIGYPPEGYPKDVYPPPGYPPQGYPQRGYPPQGYPPPPPYAPKGYPLIISYEFSTFLLTLRFHFTHYYANEVNLTIQCKAKELYQSGLDLYCPYDIAWSVSENHLNQKKNIS